MAGASSTKRGRTRAESVPENAKARYHIEAIDRGLDILRQFSAEQPELSLAEISRLTSAVPSTTLRVVNTLEDLGFLESVHGQGGYRAGPAALHLGYNMIAGSRLREVARPSLERLTAVSQEAVALGLFFGDSIYFVDFHGTGEPLSIHTRIGTRLPVYCTAAGKAVLSVLEPDAAATIIDSSDLRPVAPRTRTNRPDIESELRKTRSQGYAVQDEELAAGIRSVAAPIVDENGRPAAAVAIAVGASRYEAAELHRHIAPLVVGTAAEISARWRATVAQMSRAADNDARSIQNDADKRSRYHVEALSRGFNTLMAFEPEAPQLSLTEIIKRTDDMASTAFRVAATLTSLGYLRLDPVTNRYELTPKCLSLGYDSIVWLDMKDLLTPRLQRLRQETDGSIYLSVLGGTEAIDLVSLPRPGVMSTVGKRFPLYCTPGGKVWLAFMPAAESGQILDGIELVRRAPKTLIDRSRLEEELAAIRRDGYAVVEEENLPGVSGIGVPVFSSEGGCVASVALSISSATLTATEMKDRLLPLMRAASTDMSQRLRWRFE